MICCVSWYSMFLIVPLWFLFHSQPLWPFSVFSFLFVCDSVFTFVFLFFPLWKICVFLFWPLWSVCSFCPMVSQRSPIHGCLIVLHYPTLWHWHSKRKHTNTKTKINIAIMKHWSFIRWCYSVNRIHNTGIAKFKHKSTKCNKQSRS